MTKVEFMSELNRLLQNIPEGERQEAISYYEDYFVDAGEENEMQVLEELGSPNDVATTILEGLRGNMGYQNFGAGYQNAGFQTIGTQNVYTVPNAEEKSNKLPTWAIVLIVVLCILASPFILGGSGGILGGIVGLIAGLFGLVIGVAGAAIGLFIAGVICIASGFVTLFADFFAGLLVMGIGMLFVAVSLAFTLLVVWFFGWAIPTFVKWIISLCKGNKEKQMV